MRGKTIKWIIDEMKKENIGKTESEIETFLENHEFMYSFEQFDEIVKGYTDDKNN